jgi:hypothetical protein
VVSKAKADRVSHCTVLEGERLFGALYGVYWLTLVELKAVLQHSAEKSSPAVPTAPDEDEFQEQEMRKEGELFGSREARLHQKPRSSTKVEKAIGSNPTVSPTRNYFATLRTMEVDTGTRAGHEADSRASPITTAETSTQSGRKTASHHLDLFG